MCDTLANHRPLLARDGDQVGLDVGHDRFPERHIEVLAGPVGFACGSIPQLEVLDAQFFTKLSSGSVQRHDRLGLDGSHAPVRAERQ